MNSLPPDHSLDKQIPVFTCKNCDVTAIPKLCWQTFANRTRHIRASCAECVGYLRFLPQSPDEAKAEAGVNPEYAGGTE
jgi:hypothetical protein